MDETESSNAAKKLKKQNKKLRRRVDELECLLEEVQARVVMLEISAHKEKETEKKSSTMHIVAVGDSVRYCSNMRYKNFNKTGRVARVTAECVFIEGEKGEKHIRRLKKMLS